MIGWIEDNKVLVSVLVGSGIVMFVATLIFVPAMLVRIPPDYFAHEKRPHHRNSPRSTAGELAFRTGKNLLGAIMIIAGIAMLLLPGQGVLTMVAGLLLLDIPGKYALEKRIVSHRRVLGAINWMRRKAHREPLRTVNAGAPPRLPRQAGLAGSEPSS
jgi:hypothetical protein